MMNSTQYWIESLEPRGLLSAGTSAWSAAASAGWGQPSAMEMSLAPAVVTPLRSLVRGSGDERIREQIAELKSEAAAPATDKRMK